MTVIKLGVFEQYVVGVERAPLQVIDLVGIFRLIIVKLLHDGLLNLAERGVLALGDEAAVLLDLVGSLPPIRLDGTFDHLVDVCAIVPGERQSVGEHAAGFTARAEANPATPVRIERGLVPAHLPILIVPALMLRPLLHIHVDDIRCVRAARKAVGTGATETAGPPRNIVKALHIIIVR